MLLSPYLQIKSEFLYVFLKHQSLMFSMQQKLDIAIFCYAQAKLIAKGFLNLRGFHARV